MGLQGVLLFAGLLVCVLACKKNVVTVMPTGECGKNLNCYDCTEVPGCAWCASSSCGFTATGCYNASMRSQVVSRHPGEQMCGAEGDQWSDVAHKCKYCEQYQSCDRCLVAPIPHWVQNPSARCGWCYPSGGCERGNASGPFYRACSSRGTWRFSEDSTANKGECSVHVKCDSLTECARCIGSYESSTSACVWCADSQRCVSETKNVSCAKPVLHNPAVPVWQACPQPTTSSSESSTTSAASGESGMHSMNDLHGIPTLIAFIVALILCAVLFLFYKYGL